MVVKSEKLRIYFYTLSMDLNHKSYLFIYIIYGAKIGKVIYLYKFSIVVKSEKLHIYFYTLSMDLNHKSYLFIYIVYGAKIRKVIYLYTLSMAQ